MQRKQAIFLIAITIAFLTGCTQYRKEYSVAGIPFANAGNKLMVILAAEANAATYQKNGGYRETKYTVTYWLKVFEISTGKLANKRKLTPSLYNENISISCYGIFDDKIWLFINGLKAFDINSLDEVLNEDKIAAAAGVKKSMFAYDERLITPVVEKGYIDFLSDDDEYYRLQLKELEVINKKTIQAAESKKQIHISSMLHEEEYGVRCDTFNNAMFTFAKDEVAAKECRPNNVDVAESAYRIRLFKANFTLEKLGLYNSFSYQNINEIGNTNYLNPCFVKNTCRDEVIHLSNPGGFIVIHQDTTGEKSKAIITRVDTNGKKLWETATGVSTKIGSAVLFGKYFVFTANTNYMLNPHIGKDALCIINTETGSLLQPQLSN